ncbi:unnamed protein product [Prorocentrum cordatum]|uniref:Secreted protein n=1 Tax=Prorocentrum cordatum TaxID=2364126 RepID=A0ABN9UAV2_9DINO|nr:unnamed protein product [Polarella glacialis]
MSWRGQRVFWCWTRLGRKLQRSCSCNRGLFFTLVRVSGWPRFSRPRSEGAISEPHYVFESDYRLVESLQSPPPLSSPIAGTANGRILGLDPPRRRRSFACSWGEP